MEEFPSVEEIFRTKRRIITAAAYHVVGADQSAIDAVTSDVFFSLISDYDRISKYKAPLGRVLTVISHNAACNYIRSRKINKVEQVDGDVLDQLMPEDIDMVCEDEKDGAFATAFETLSADDQDWLRNYVKRYEGTKQQVGVVRSRKETNRAARLRRRLRKQVQKLTEPELPKTVRMAECCPNRLYHCNGLCRRCYKAKWNREHKKV